MPYNVIVIVVNGMRFFCSVREPQNSNKIDEFNFLIKFNIRF